MDARFITTVVHTLSGSVIHSCFSSPNGPLSSVIIKLVNFVGNYTVIDITKYLHDLGGGKNLYLRQKVRGPVYHVRTAHSRMIIMQSCGTKV